MKKKLLFVLILLLISAAACGGSDGGDGLPTRAELSVTPTPDESPRIGPDSDLPPTWTPEPTGEVATPVVAGEEGTAEPNTDGQETYVVQAGDTLAEIAAANGVTLDALVDANNIANVDVIEVGQVLIIP
jgi:LysM repeat protein